MHPIPHPNDTVVTDATTLWNLVSGPAAEPKVSIRISGYIDLGEIDPFEDEVSGKTMFKWIEFGQELTLWSDNGGTLNATRKGRVFQVNNGGYLRLEGIRLTGGFARGNGGGCLLMTGGIVMVNESTFEDCEITRTSGTALGGGVGVRSGQLALANTRFLNTRVVSEVQNSAFGGGVAVHGGGFVEMRNVSFVGTSVSSSR